VLRHRISYLSTISWCRRGTRRSSTNTDAGLQAALEIFEFANSQLLEFRYYDDLLESELARIYDTLQEPRWYDALGPRYVRAARRLHALFVDVNELTDKTENALKMVGDVYAARLYALVAAAARPGPVEAERRREARHARRHLSLHGGADADVARASASS